MLTVNALLFKHYVYQEDILEGNTDLEHIKQSYDRWSNWCVITTITPKYIKIELPNKSKSSERPISYYADYKILKGLWVVCTDYGADTEQYYWCRNWLQVLMRKLMCRARCSSPYLIHTIDL